jgi:hypothetical protein
VEGSCDHCNEPLGSIKYWEILDKLNNCWLFKKGTASWRQYFVSALLIVKVGIFCQWFEETVNNFFRAL